MVHDEVTFNGVFMLKAPTEAGAPPRYFDNYEPHETLSANGRTLTIDHQGLYKDLHDRPSSRARSTSSCPRSRVSRSSSATSDGNVLFRDRGVLKSTFLVDTKGDTDLDNDVFIEGSFELLADHGSHPASTSTSVSS